MADFGCLNDAQRQTFKISNDAQTIVNRRRFGMGFVEFDEACGRRFFTRNYEFGKFTRHFGSVAEIPNLIRRFGIYTTRFTKFLLKLFD